MAKISDRLFSIYSKVSKNSRVIDVGTDHAIIPISLVENEVADFVIASDVSRGPLNSAQDNIEDSEVNTNKISLRLGPGLTVVDIEDNIDTVIISGMGGELMSKIINDAPKFLFNSDVKFILQPNNEESLVRLSLNKHNIGIIDEEIIDENDHFYEVIIGKTGIKSELSNEDLEFGPFLKKEKSSIWLKKWNHQLDVLNIILEKLGASQSKRIDEVKVQINKINEVIKNV